jgi:hypothetical protein
MMYELLTIMPSFRGSNVQLITVSEHHAVQERLLLTVIHILFYECHGSPRLMIIWVWRKNIPSSR